MGHKKKSPDRPLRRPPAESVNERTAVAQLCQQSGRRRHPRSRRKEMSEFPALQCAPPGDSGRAAMVQGNQQPHSLKKTSKSPEELLQRASGIESGVASAMVQPYLRKCRQGHPGYHGKVNLSKSSEQLRKCAPCGNSGEAAITQPHQQEDEQRRLRSHNKENLSDSPEESLQDAQNDGDSEETMAQRYRLGRWLEYACILLVVLIFAEGLVISPFDEHAWKEECSRRNEFVIDTPSRLLHQNLLQKKEEEIERLESRENECTRMKQQCENNIQRIVEGLQTYLQGQEGRLNKQIQGLKSQVDNREREIEQMRESSAQQVELLHSCQADVQSIGIEMQKLQDKHISEVERLQQEQERKLSEKDKEIRELQKVIQHLQEYLQEEKEHRNKELEEKDKEIQTQYKTIQRIDKQKRRLESEIAQCERRFEDLKSTHNDGSWWGGLKFTTGVGFGGAICSMSKILATAVGGFDSNLKL